MSYTITVDIFCDSCPAWMEEGGAAASKPDKKEANGRAKWFGWTVKGKKHYCPKCVEKRKALSDREGGWGMSELLISLDRQRCKNLDHGPFLIDESASEVECKTCGHRMNPMYALTLMARNDRRWKWRNDELKRIADKATEKNKTKCEHCSKMTRIVKVRT